MKHHGDLTVLFASLMDVKSNVRTVSGSFKTVEEAITRVGDWSDARSPLGHNELASARFKITQAKMLLEQAHAVLCESELELFQQATARGLAVDLDQTEIRVA